MLILMMAALQAATATAPAPDFSKAVPVPMTSEVWKSMDGRQRERYADVLIQGLRRNPVMSRCVGLTPPSLAAQITTAAKSGEPLMMAEALATHALCPDL